MAATWFRKYEANDCSGCPLRQRKPAVCHIAEDESHRPNQGAENIDIINQRVNLFLPSTNHLGLTVYSGLVVTSGI
jgi:hypothetical protein